MLLLSFSLSLSAKDIDIIIAKGEQKEIQIGRLKNFSVGNPEVISYKHLEKARKILFKGKRIGFTDFIIWTEKEKMTFNIYVLSKNKFLKTFQLAEALKNLDLNLDLKGPVITASGIVNNLNDYLYLKKLEKQFPSQLFFKIKMSAELRNEIIVKVYQKFYQARAKFVSCNHTDLKIDCDYFGLENKDLLKQLSQLYNISFAQRTAPSKYKNYRLKLKLLQLEKTNGQEIHLGLDQLKSSMSDLFEFGLKRLIDDNILFLTKSKLELSTLAEPEMIITVGEKNKVEIGSQVPYQNLGNEGQNIVAPISWQFAGLKIMTTLSEKRGDLFIKYETEFTRPQGQSITGNKETSSAIITVGQPLKIFQIGFQTIAKSQQGIPGLSDIPILKHIFQSKSNHKSFKQIYGYLLLEELP